MHHKTILITGSSSGFGFGAAKALAAKGHTVFATMRGVDGSNAPKAEDLRRWSEANGNTLHVIELDVTSDASVAAAVDLVFASTSKLDVLVNNAGVGTWGLQEAFEVSQVQAMFNVNVFGILRMNRAVLPRMRDAGDGYVIYVSSGLGRIMLPFLGPYTASKHAVEAIAEIGSYELGPMGVSTTILQPGAYGTSFLGNSVQPKDQARLESQPLVKAMFEAFGGAFEQRTKAGLLGNPEEIVDAIVDLVELDKASRPLRKTVGADVQQAVMPINEACEQVQNHLLMAFGLR